VNENEVNGIIPRNLALGGEKGSVMLADVGAGDWGKFSIHNGEAQRDGSIDVPVATLDEIVHDCGLAHVDVVKIDVEGYEPHVLKGARSTIERHRPEIFLETSPAWLSKSDLDLLVSQIEWLLALGYEFLDVSGDHNERVLAAKEILEGQRNLHLRPMGSVSEG
jgi:FkbM family methyltransferase